MFVNSFKFSARKNIIWNEIWSIQLLYDFRNIHIDIINFILVKDDYKMYSNKIKPLRSKIFNLKM